MKTMFLQGGVLAINGNFMLSYTKRKLFVDGAEIFARSEKRADKFLANKKRGEVILWHFVPGAEQRFPMT